MRKNCKLCNKLFERIKTIVGGSKRQFCYECLPLGKTKTERDKFYYKAIMAYSNKVKMDLGCSKCGYKKCIKALEWHHPNGNKDRDPSTILKSRGIEAYMVEITKCILLCANCHRELH